MRANCESKNERVLNTKPFYISQTSSSTIGAPCTVSALSLSLNFFNLSLTFSHTHTLARTHTHGLTASGAYFMRKTALASRPTSNQPLSRRRQARLARLADGEYQPRFEDTRGLGIRATTSTTAPTTDCFKTKMSGTIGRGVLARGAHTARSVRERT